MEIATSQKVTTFLMFEGNAEEAMTFYLSLFDDAEVAAYVAAVRALGPDAQRVLDGNLVRVIHRHDGAVHVEPVTAGVRRRGYVIRLCDVGAHQTRCLP